MLRLIVCLLLFSLSVFGKPQDRGFFRQVWLEDGLSQSSVTCITQDDNGFMWFGSQDGLNRFDGKTVDQYNFQPFNSNSISGDQLHSLCNDDKRLWILSSAGLDKFDLHTGKVERLSKSKKISKEGNSYTPFRIWRLNGSLYMFGSSGFEELDPVSLKRTRFKFDRKQDGSGFMVYQIASASDLTYFSTNQGLYAGRKSSSLIKKVEGGWNTEPCYQVISHQNKICVSQKEKLILFDPNTGKISEVTCGTGPAAHITALLCDNRGYVWVGTNGNGLFRFTVSENGLSQDKHFIDEPGIRFSLRCNFISCLYQGNNPNEDVVWIGTRDAGAVSYSYAKNSFVLQSARIKEGNRNFFGTIKDSKGVIYSGTNNGLYIIPPNGQPVFTDLSGEQGMMQQPIETFYCDENDVIWGGLNNDLFIIRENKIIRKASDVSPNNKAHIMKIARYSDSLLFIGTSYGYVLFNKFTNKVLPPDHELPKRNELNYPSVGSVLRDAKGNLWIGSNAGLIQFDPKGKRTIYKHTGNEKESILSDVVMDIAETAKGEILAGTTKGLSILSPAADGYRIENHFKNDGLYNNFIYYVVPDQKGNFWLTTNFGITCFNPELRSFRSFTASDGVFLNEFNSGGAYSAPDGEILLGGIGGLISFYPEKITRTRVRPGISLRKVTVNKNEITLPDLETLSDLAYKQNNINLEFSVIDFSDDGKTKLLYRLNSEKEWMIVDGSNSLSLANLAPGTYKLQVKAVNRDGLESESPLILSFTINSPFWLSWWFSSILVASFVALAWLIHKNNVRKKIRIIQERERIREEENEKLRKTAALDLHDEFGNGLTRISMLVELARLKGLQENQEASKILNIISDNSSRLYQGTKDYIWSINAGNDNLYEVIIRIKDFADELFYERGTKVIVTGLTEDLKSIRQVPGTGRNVAMIFKEALSNIMKHAGATIVILSVERNGNIVSLSLKDNGKGFDTSRNGSGFGLGNMKQRASRVNAELKVTSTSGSGSEILLTLNEYK